MKTNIAFILIFLLTGCTSQRNEKEINFSIIQAKTTEEIIEYKFNSDKSVTYYYYSDVDPIDTSPELNKIGRERFEIKTFKWNLENNTLYIYEDNRVLKINDPNKNDSLHFAELSWEKVNKSTVLEKIQNSSEKP